MASNLHITPPALCAKRYRAASQFQQLKPNQYMPPSTVQLAEVGFRLKKRHVLRLSGLSNLPRWLRYLDFPSWVWGRATREQSFHGIPIATKSGISAVRHAASHAVFPQPEPGPQTNPGSCRCNQTFNGWPPASRAMAHGVAARLRAFPTLEQILSRGPVSVAFVRDCHRGEHHLRALQARPCWPRDPKLEESA